MEQTESKVVQVAPNYENNKIQEQQIFGWNLHGRQEMHEEGNTEGGPNLLGDGYTVKTQVSTYVKLHFVRSMEMPNIGRIRELETEYNSLARPQYPSLVPGGFGALIFWFPLWLVLYIPFGYIRKKGAADEQSRKLRAKYDDVSNIIKALSG